MCVCVISMLRNLQENITCSTKIIYFVGYKKYKLLLHIDRII